MKIKALNKVPVLIEGEVVNLEPGQQYDVPDDIGEALLRGKDAAPVAETPVKAREPEPVKPQKKNAGKAPANKNAGKAPEDK